MSQQYPQRPQPQPQWQQLPWQQGNQPPPGYQQNHQQQWRPGPPGAGGSTAVRRKQPVPATLLLVSALAFVLSMVMPWLELHKWSSQDSGGISVRAYNGTALHWAWKGIKNDSVLGLLLLFALLLAAMGAMLAVIAALQLFTGHQARGLAISGAVIGMVATLGTGVFILVLSGGEDLNFLFAGYWIYVASFMPALIGLFLIRRS